MCSEMSSEPPGGVINRACRAHDISPLYAQESYLSVWLHCSSILLAFSFISHHNICSAISTPAVISTHIFQNGSPSLPLLPLPKEQTLHQVTLLPWCPRIENQDLRRRCQESPRRSLPLRGSLGLRRKAANLL